MSTLQQQGTIQFIGAKEQVTEKFAKRLLVIGFKDGNYDKSLAIEFGNDKCDLLSGQTIGSTVNVSFNLESRAWGDKWFTSAKGWKCEAVGQQPSTFNNSDGAKTDTAFGEPDPNEEVPF